MKKVILITGASRGLGKVIYDYLISLNKYHVYGSSRNPEDDNLLKLDITDEESVTNCLSWIIDKEGRIDVLINNVGSNLIGSLEGTSIESYQKEMDTNFYGSIRMIQGILPYFREFNNGRIINISSIGAKVPLPYNSSYSASKSALEAMSESLVYELDGSDIYVSLVQPIGLRIEDEIPNIKYIYKEKTWHKKSLLMYKNLKKYVEPNVSKKTVALKIEKIMNANKPKLRYTVGNSSKAILFAHFIFNQYVFGKLLEKSLFRNS